MNMLRPIFILVLSGVVPFVPAQTNEKGAVVEKVIPEKAILYTHHELKSPAEIGMHAGKDIPMLEALAKQNGYVVNGPVEHAYWDMAKKGAPHFLEIWLPVKKREGQNVKEYKVVGKYKCLSAPFIGDLEKIGEAWGKFGEVASTKKVEITHQDREVYVELNFENPEKNRIELQMGIP